MKRLLLLAATCVLSTAEAGEYLYQAPVGVTAFGVQAAYRGVQTYRNDDEGSDPTSGGGLYRAGVSLDHGLTEQIAVGANLAYTDLKLRSEGTFRPRGFEPLQIYLRGHHTLPQASLLYGADLRVGLERAAVRRGGAANRVISDPIDGLGQRLVLTPYLGAATDFGANRAGVVYSYDIYKMGTEFDLAMGAKATIERANRSILSGFFEHRFEGVLVGADLGWIKFWEGKVRGPVSGEAFAGYGLMRAEAYANVALTPTAALIPTITSISTLLSDYEMDMDDLRVTLAYRQTF